MVFSQLSPIMMGGLVAAFVFSASLAFKPTMMSQSHPETGGITRRAAIAGMMGIAAATLTSPQSAFAADKNVEVYFGCGCFWHVQYEFIKAERQILGRADNELSSLTGYAGGTKVGKDTNRPGKELVCYHNLQRVGDYGKLGHGEVVGMSIPEDKIGNFAEEYFKLFDKNGDRADPQDRGPEYRSLLGLPGGVKSPLFPKIQEAAANKNMKVIEGKGNDQDTLGKRLVWVMDSNTFPFYQGEVYHQFHDDMIEDYPKEYNALRGKLYKSGLFGPTGCPDIV